MTLLVLMTISCICDLILSFFTLKQDLYGRKGQRGCVRRGKAPRGGEVKRFVPSSASMFDLFTSLWKDYKKLSKNAEKMKRKDRGQTSKKCGRFEKMWRLRPNYWGGWKATWKKGSPLRISCDDISTCTWRQRCRRDKFYYVTKTIAQDSGRWLDKTSLFSSSSVVLPLHLMQAASCR